MKTKHIFWQLFVAFHILFLSSAPAQSEGPLKILIIITESRPESGALEVGTIESLMGKNFLEANYQIIMSDSLTPSAQFSESDILGAKKGNIPNAGKIAGAYGANLILIASVKTRVTSQEVHKVKTSKAVTTISYKLADTISGGIIAMDSKTYRSAAMSPDEAKHRSFEKMAADIAKIIPQKASSRAVAPLAASPPTKPQEVTVTPLPESAFPIIIITNPSGRGLSRGLSKGLSRGLSRGLTRGLTRDGSFVIKGEVRDNSGIEIVKINDRSVTVDGKGAFSYNTPLSPGDNHFLLTVTNALGNTATKDIVITKEKPRLSAGVRPVLWGLAIGVSEYADPGLNLEYADKDALSLAQAIRKQDGRMFSEVHFKTLVNEEVTRNSIIENITSHLGMAAPDDVIFMFIAGHGIKHQRSGSYYFVPHDADADSILSKGLRMSDFDEAVKILSKDVNKVIIAMDTCHSGAMKVGTRALGGGENLAETLREASGIFILAASKGGESSLEDEKFMLHEGDSGHGAFTYALIQGMSGKANYDRDEYISLNELFQYVAKQVPRLTEGQQHPYFRTEGTDMPFILLKK